MIYIYNITALYKYNSIRVLKFKYKRYTNTSSKPKILYEKTIINITVLEYDY